MFNYKAAAAAAKYRARESSVEENKPRFFLFLKNGRKRIKKPQNHMRNFAVADELLINLPNQL